MDCEIAYVLNPPTTFPALIAIICTNSHACNQDILPHSSAVHDRNHLGMRLACLSRYLCRVHEGNKSKLSCLSGHFCLYFVSDGTDCPIAFIDAGSDRTLAWRPEAGVRGPFPSGHVATTSRTPRPPSPRMLPVVDEELQTARTCGGVVSAISPPTKGSRRSRAVIAIARMHALSGG